MKSHSRWCFALAALLSILPRLIDAQLPSATDAQREAGSMVASVEFDHDPIDLMVGDSVDLVARFLDADGNEISGVAWAILSFGTSVASARRDSENDYVYRVLGRKPGEGELSVFLMVPEDEANSFGRAGLKRMDGLSVNVRDWPIDRIEITGPAHAAYVGTSYKVAAKVMTVRENVHGLAGVTWSSDNPLIAVTTSTGAISFLAPGTASILASTDEGVSATYVVEVQENPVRQLAISPATTSTRTGDIVHFDVVALDGRGRAVEDIALTYSIFGLDSAGAQLFDDGAFVAENPGSYRVIVTAGGSAAYATIEVEARPGPSRVTLVGRGAVSEVATSDLWVFEGNDGRDYAYTGTHANGGGERLFVWDVTDPSEIELVDSVVVDARVVNDVKVNGDATWAIITREGASNRRNGIVVLDIQEPAHPRVIAELTENMTGGIHNVWINGDVVYTVNNGTNAVDIIDMSDPHNPTYHGRWELRPGDTNKNLHDVWADGRYAYVSYWDDGLVILDVGAGTHGGTALDPQFVSRISYEMGNTHTAWREGDYVFLGDEIGTADGMRGYIHVIDVADIENPVEVARYEVPEAGAHNIWVENGSLYIAYYQGGLRIVDISGELRGDLYRQGRETGRIRTAGAEGEAIVPNAPQAWGPQPFKGNIFVSDMNSGLWVVHHDRAEDLNP